MDDAAARTRTSPRRRHPAHRRTRRSAPSEVEFVLSFGPNPFWWKPLLLPDGTTLEIENATRVATARVDADQVRTGTELIFSKLVRLFLFATGRRVVYRLADLAWIPSGSRLTFSWDQD